MKFRPLQLKIEKGASHQMVQFNYTPAGGSNENLSEMSSTTYTRLSRQFDPASYSRFTFRGKITLKHW